MVFSTICGLAQTLFPTLRTAALGKKSIEATHIKIGRGFILVSRVRKKMRY